MYSSETHIRVRYAETDQMGFVYYGNYAQYFEVARVEGLRQLGMNYKLLEAEGVILPVLDFSIKFIKPAYYDDLLTIKTTIPEIPKVRIKFLYETYSQKGERLNTAETTLAFLTKQSNKPCAAPADFIDKIKKYF